MFYVCPVWYCSLRSDAMLAIWQKGILELLTSNLHALVCRLGVQEMQRGPVCLDIELWVERCIQQMKSHTKSRVHSDPEKLVVNNALMRMQLLKHAAEHDGMRTLDEWRAHLSEAGHASLQGPSTDSGRLDNDGLVTAQLMGKGHKMPGDNRDVPLLLQFVGALPDRYGWGADQLADATFEVFQRVLLGQARILTSSEYTRQHSKYDNLVEVKLDEAVGHRHVAEVLYYVRGRSASLDESGRLTAAVRLAVCKVYSRVAEPSAPFRPRQVNPAHHQRLVLDVESLGNKFISWKRFGIKNGVLNELNTGKWYVYSKYMPMSRNV